MSQADLAGVRACVFDAYGTLFDIVSAVTENQVRVGEHAHKFSKVWRRKQLEYTWLRSLMGRYVNFQKITEDALDYSMQMFGVDDAQLRADLLSAYDKPPPQADAIAALQRLRSADLATVVVSNAVPQMLDDALASAGLSELFDIALSAAEVREYKPSRRVYQLAQSWLQLQPEQIAYCSTNPWDIAGAGAFGFRSVWINRFDLRPEKLGTDIDAELPSLEGLPELLGA